MLILHAHTIPAWLVGMAMILTGIMWLLSTNKELVRIDTRLFAIIFIINGIVFAFIYQLVPMELEMRGFFARLMIIVLSLSQCVPLAVAQIKRCKANDKQRNNSHRHDTRNAV